LSPAAGGLVAVVTSSADNLRIGKVLTGDSSHSLVWIPAGTQPERAGLLTLHRPGIRAVSIAPAGRELRRAWPALQFAHRLGLKADGRARLTSADAPATVDRSTRMPHLISVRYGTGTLTDTVVWELMARTVAPEWSRVPPVDQAFIEAHLHRLVTLRGVARGGRLPSTAAGRRLASLLGERPLTIRTVYEHLDVLRHLVIEMSGQAQRSPPAADRRQPISTCAVAVPPDITQQTDEPACAAVAVDRPGARRHDVWNPRQ